MKRFFIETWGCQMNLHDSERLSTELRALGMEPAATAGHADLILLNTCSVREKPAEKIFAYLGRLKPVKQKNPDVRIGVCGCVGQQEREKIFRRSPLVDFVLGPGAISRIAHVVRELDAGARELVECGTYPVSELNPERQTGVGAYVVIMEGCNNFCSFCVVPYTRGRERSRPHSQILSEVERLLALGVKEIELLGQNVNSYRDGDVGFSQLLGFLDAMPGLLRLRFTTSHPKDFEQDIIDAMRDLESVCPHIHLPVQSGSDPILASMNRKYTRLDYLDRIRRLKEAIPEIAITSDIIVGFPGESEEDHRQTMSLLEEVAYDAIYSFKYSPRPQTKAERLEDDVPPEVKQRRLKEVQELQTALQTRKNSSFVGKTLQVLVVGRSKRHPDEFTGRSECHRVVNFSSGTDCLHRLVDVEITRSHPNSLYGEIIEVKRDESCGDSKKYHLQT
ncbi:tRNA (N6-isopentenyl adenosine(37)-C2)-methylthiotransferase MiaB [Acidobacteriota bacterium]